VTDDRRMTVNRFFGTIDERLANLNRTYAYVAEE
jgi:hypothetical protein